MVYNYEGQAMNNGHFYRYWACFLLTAIVFAPAFAQMVIQADLARLQPQIQRDDGGFSACGVRALVITSTVDSADLYDFSLMVRANMFAGMLKAGKLHATKSTLLKGALPSEAVVPGPVKFWIAKENEGQAASASNTAPSESKGYILGTADWSLTLDAILAMIHGERMQFATRYKKQPLDLVISFSENMPEHERNPLMTCITSVMDRLKAQAMKRLSEMEDKP
jgi:hypothetical protein